MHALLAQVDATTASEFSSWGQLGANGVMLALFAYLVTKGIPNIIAEFRAESALIRAEAAAHRTWAEKQIEALISQADKRELMFERCVEKFNETTLKLMQGTRNQG